MPAWTLIVIGVLLAGGCATAGSVRAEPKDAGVGFTFPEPCEVVANAVVPTLLELGFALGSTAWVEPCGLTAIMVKPASVASWGEVVRVVVTPLDAGGTGVRVLTRRVLATNVTARGDWSGQVHRALVKRIEETHEPGF